MHLFLSSLQFVVISLSSSHIAVGYDVMPSSYAGGASFITNSRFSAIEISGTGMEVGGGMTMGEIGTCDEGILICSA